MKKEYTNGEITVVWQPTLCMHSEICYHGLVEVFNPDARPWINMEGADTERIAAQVDKCPSGALSWYRNDAQAPEPMVAAEDVVVEVTANGPLLVHGTIMVKQPNGETIRKEKVTALCRCGGSANKPYCDGTHRTNGFTG